MKKKIYSLLIAGLIVTSFGSVPVCAAEATSQNSSVEQSETKEIDQYQFDFSGGSGRVVLKCTKVEQKGDQFFATICFEKSSGKGKCQYDKVKVNGKTYEGKNTFSIPVTLNQNMTIEAETLAMSEAHWIEYTIMVSTGSGDEKKLSETRGCFDESAPIIQGLTISGDDEDVNGVCEYLRAFDYEDGYKLVEVDWEKQTAREKDQQKSNDNLYMNKVVKYLFVPAGKEAPAGIEDDLVVLEKTPKNVYAATKDIYKFMEKLGLEKSVKAVGFEDAGKIKLEKDVVFAGAYDKWELKKLISAKISLAILPSELLPSEKKDADHAMEVIGKYGKQSAQTNMVLWIDRKDDEKDEKAVEVWETIYETMMGKE